MAYEQDHAAYRANQPYIKYVWEVFSYLICKTFVSNIHVYKNIGVGIHAVYSLILIILGAITSPLLCWYGAYTVAKTTRKRYADNGGVFYGKMAHLNKKQVDSE